jgi:hypothetical protein
MHKAAKEHATPLISSILKKMIVLNKLLISSNRFGIVGELRKGEKELSMKKKYF